jgi:hypothetical protein
VFSSPRNRLDWFSQHPAVSFFKEYAVLVLERPTGVAPKNHRSFRELVGSLECFPGQYRHSGSGRLIFQATYAGLPLLSFILFSTCQTQQVFAWFLRLTRPVVTGNWPTLSTSRVSCDPSRALPLLGPTLLLSKKRALLRFALRRFEASPRIGPPFEGPILPCHFR